MRRDFDPDDFQPVQGNPKPFLKPVEEEIIIKCSIEEMMKAFFKDYVIVWHDPRVNHQENQQYIAQLKEFCEVFTFTEWEKAKDYIQSTQAVCHVITSGTNGELLVKDISLSQSVENIYIFCTNKEYHSLWAKNFAKVSCIETEIEEVFSKIQQNLLGWYKEASSLNLSLPAFAPIFNDSDKSEMNNLHRYLGIIPNFKNREQAKEDFGRLSRKIYSDPINTKLLEEFEKDYNEYNTEKTLRWYTRESFLYKVTNNCLRIATSDSIQYCRLALKDIEQAIKDQYHAESKNFNGLLYRGAYLSDKEWSNLKDNVDREIEMHGFLSVSKKKNIALNFMQADPSKKVFITMIVPKGPNEEKQGFAEMEKYSQYPMEKEVLFNVRSRFTVLETEDDYEYSAASRCRHLVLLYGAQGFRKFMTEQNPIQEVSIPNMESVLCAHCSAKNKKVFFVSISEDRYYCKACINHGVAPFLCVPNIDKVNTAAKIKGCLLTIDSSQEQTPFYGYRCSHCQAKRQKCYFTCTDCENKWCENCFDSKTHDCLKVGHNMILETSPFSFWCEKMSANEFNHLKFQNNLLQDSDDIFQQAQMYYESQEYEKAIEYYCLYIQENEAKGGLNLALSYHNVGMVYDHQGEYKKALESYLKSLDIRKSIYGGDSHQLVAASYHNIGRAYHNQGEAKKALDYLFKALDIRKAVYGGENHLDIASSYNSIGLVFQNQGEYKKALEYYLKTLDIRKSVYEGDNHPEVAIAYLNIGTLYDNLGEYKKALEYHWKSMDITKLVYGASHPEVSASYNNLGQGYDGRGEYKKALECYFKSLDIQKSIYGEGEDHPQIAICYNNIGGVYHKQGEYEKALEYFLKSLKIQKSVYAGDNHPQVAGSYNNIGNCCDYMGEYEKALEYYLKSLDIQKSVYGGDNHPLVANSFNNIGVAYLNQGENEKALEYLFKALDIQKAVYGGENHPLVAISYSNIADVYDNQGEHKKALEYYLKGLEIEKSVYGEDHPDTIETQNQILEKINSQKEN